MEKHFMPSETEDLLKKGTVIPALPLALNSKRRLDERSQRALIRYYLDAGAGGIAVGVHTTQFAIRKPEIGIYNPLLKIASDEMDNYTGRTGRTVIKIAGVIGKTGQAVKEVEQAQKNGYNAALLSLAAFKDDPNSAILEHCRRIAKILPVFGFYLQPAVGGRKLDLDFWRGFAGIENVIAIKIAPFNRYQTLDVVRGVAESGRADDIALYTGNDDSILVDLLTEYRIKVNGTEISKRIAGGLLGHWAVWTRSAVTLLEDVKKGVFDKDVKKALILANQITDCNAAFFDTANNFRGCIAGLHEVLRRQGLFKGIWTLDPEEKLSPGQKKEIDRVYAAYPHLNDDKFISENLDKWLG
ncbi:MAG TPA: dihydrodipicolinate synthase family protein [Bacteroidales bacterium]|nr:dihydrodipicolinate synthase family protein [Bacteroidales bacterium]HOX73827.1 dihydrodipicolinate synthase family protein [Bacteroidales bacterium]HPM88248.1 dihydrodipicolinate synthase family protein [Bacteroidales bacterium]HQM68389.1 dihydrodipicolinate synthase family protein [Bacteroidales bacterium]